METKDESGQPATPYTIEGLRKRMENALALQQNQVGHVVSSEPPSMADRIALRRSVADGQGSSGESLEATTAGSTESVRTIKGTKYGTPGAVRTPSYPFPRMALRLPRGHSQLSGPRHKPFTLLSPTNASELDKMQSSPAEILSSNSSTPVDRQQFQPLSKEDDLPEDPNYPLPDLYDLVLLLNAEPGLDAWWSNVTEILTEAYGAERASLAVPGDMTDLENVPWGQKASFNVFGVDRSDSSVPESTVPSDHVSGREQDFLLGRRGEDTSYGNTAKLHLRTNLKRPLLESRHSIAGVIPDSIRKTSRQRPSAPVRAISGRNETIALETHRAIDESLSNHDRISEESATVADTVSGSSKSDSQGVKAVVHRALRALESEQTPLIVRTGVTALFGKRRPVVMTRSFADSTASPGLSKSNERSVTDDGNSLQGRHRMGPQQSTASDIGSSSILSMDRSRFSQIYEEYEQAEPSPWSKSPHPSPAARPDPSESPFFNQSAHVDETAFTSEPPAYDYSVNQPVEAIGTDCSKTLIHIPLIQPVPSRRPPSSNLRFPTAIISLLSPVTPYPLSLRHSLAALLPHLASSYSLAQQFSSLEAQTHGRPLSRYSRGLGLGGTFSDESSELELVAELSGQIARGPGEELRRSAHGSVTSPSERSTVSKGSPAGTPLFESAGTGFTPGLPPTPGRSGAEMVDSYFSSRRQKAVGPAQNPPRTPGGIANSKPRQSIAEDSSARSGKRPKPVAILQVPARTKMSTSKKLGSSNPSSPRQGTASEVLEGEALHLEPLAIETHDLSVFRHSSAAFSSGVFCRTLADERYLILFRSCC